MARIYNFAAGPAVLPEEVLREVAAEMLDYKGEGMSILEMSHRGKTIDAIHNEALDMIRELLSVPDHFEILFLQGGGHTQFAMVPLNLLGTLDRATYLVNGVWSKKAAAEAGKWCSVQTIGSPTFTSVPVQSEIQRLDESAYLYYCQNETVNGLEFNYVPSVPANLPLVADISSNFMTRRVDFEKHALVFAGAQKNFGPAGLTVAIVRKDLLGHASSWCPSMLNYAIHAKGNSMYNTPPVFSVYVANLVCHWLKKEGGVDAMDALAKKRSALLYNVIDTSDGFYVNRYKKEDRSRINVVFTLKDEKLQETFVNEAAAEGLKNIKGHRLLGGMRVSLYNAMPLEGACAMSDFMTEFMRTHG